MIAFLYHLCYIIGAILVPLIVMVGSVALLTNYVGNYESKWVTIPTLIIGTLTVFLYFALMP